jgi:N-acyl-D-amino-acid deacylase
MHGVDVRFETASMPTALVVRGGLVVDGTGAPGRAADVLVRDDRIVTVGEVPDEADAEVLDATGHVVAPGFVNVLSHAWGSLQRDPTGASDLLQGVTTEVFGEAFSLGPSDERLVESLKPWGGLAEGSRVDFARLSEGLDHLAAQGVAPNVASFVGGTNLRILAAGFEDGPADPAALDRVRGILEEEMQEGALGVGTALIYPPGRFAGTDELVSLCEVVGRYDGMYISHMRSEGDQFLECLDELLTIGRRASVRTEVYHLKAAGQHNWPKMKQAIEVIDEARRKGEPVSADMYPYTAGGTALAAAIPPRFHVGGPSVLRERLGDPSLRAELGAEIRQRSDEFENLFLAAGGGKGILFFEDFADGTPAAGRRLSDIASDMGMDEPEALLEIVAREPGSGVAYFIIDEDNVRLGLQQPWVSIGSDAAAHQAIPPYSDDATHPRTYGTFARVLGRYCRDEGLFPLEEAVRRMTSLPSDNLGLTNRGRLEPGGFADIAVFDAANIRDTATYDEPHSYAEGVRHVVVNGVPVVREGALTKETPGRRLRRGRR